MHRCDIFDELQTGLAGQSYIHQHEVRVHGPEALQCLFGIARLAAYNQIGLLADQLGHPMPRERMVIHQQDFSFGLECSAFRHC